MIGRVDERTHIEGLLADARSGRSGALVLFGDPGVGKSMLLSHAVDLSDGFVVLRATGVESEVDLAFAAPTIREYQQVVAHYAPSAGYFPLSWWVGFAVLCAYTVTALGMAVIRSHRPSGTGVERDVR